MSAYVDAIDGSPSVHFETHGAGGDWRGHVGIVAAHIPAADRPWFLTLAREGLRRAVGLPGWHEARGPQFQVSVDRQIASHAADWAAVVNALSV